MAGLHHIPETVGVTPGECGRRTETGSVMIDVLSMRIQRACRGIHSRLSAGKDEGMFS
jgi:hypothetical protein